MRSLTRKQTAILLILIVLGSGAGLFWYFESNRTQFRFEAVYPEGDTRKVILALVTPRDANLTISFENDTSLMYRIDAELYDPGSDSVRFEHDRVNVHSLHLYCEGRQQRIAIVLGIAAKYDITIFKGENLNTTVRYGNGAVLNETWFVAYQTGVLRIAVDEHDGLTTHGSMLIGGGVPESIDGPLYLMLDIDLPDGYGGRLSTYGIPISFIERQGWGFYGNGVFATAATVERPRVTIGLACTSILARLID
ncbi:hypothetical protein EU538_12845 [Candidatus Thorarchaeota archaeon]|nr:MAG: hypothetical protein EU538_12845 [Candidatus Thorarchaeota archaeon]